MKCNNCGSKNPETNIFCSECGSKLKKPEKDVLYCNKCGFENNIQNKYCEQCGSALRQFNNKSDKKANKQRQGRKTGRRRVEKKLDLIDLIEKHKTATVVILFVVGYGLLKLFSPGEEVIRRQNIPNRQTNLAYGFQATKINSIASKFICSCGTCGELPLEECECPTAVEEKNFIKSKLDQKVSEENIIRTVAKKYGRLKPQFAGKYSPNQVELRNPAAEVDNNSSTVSNFVLASLSDRDAIVRQFQCPCGQCGIDELIDCNCTHPRGAKEVKDFIKNKINENLYSTAQIISMVDRTYGGKK